MDPDAAINIILRGTESGDYERVAEACENLRTWLRNGGFAPTINSDVLRRLLQLAQTGAETIAAFYKEEKKNETSVRVVCTNTLLKNPALR